jgi:hypothetical protein
MYDASPTPVASTTSTTGTQYVWKFSYMDSRVVELKANPV